MSQTALINMQTLARLADAGTEQQLVDLGAMPVSSDIRAALAAEAAKRKEEVLKLAANEILNISANADVFLAQQIAAKNALLEQISGIDKLTAAVARARAYGFSVNNFLPLASALCLSVPASTKAELKNVPKDFEVAAVAA